MSKERCQLELSYSVDFRVAYYKPGWKMRASSEGMGPSRVGGGWLWGHHVCLSVLKNKLFLWLCYLFWLLVTRTASNLGCNLSLSWNYLIKLLEYSRTTPSSSDLRNKKQNHGGHKELRSEETCGLGCYTLTEENLGCCQGDTEFQDDLCVYQALL